MPCAASEQIPPLRRVKTCGTVRKVPEIGSRSRFPPLVPSPLFGGRHRHLAANPSPPRGGRGFARFVGSPPHPLVPRPLSPAFSRFREQNCSFSRRKEQIPPCVGREACRTVKTARKVEACGTVRKGSNHGPDDAISRKLRLWAPGAGT